MRLEVYAKLPSNIINIIFAELIGTFVLTLGIDGAGIPQVGGFLQPVLRDGVVPLFLEDPTKEQQAGMVGAGNPVVKPLSSGCDHCSASRLRRARTRPGPRPRR